MKAVLYDWGGLNLWLFYLINGNHAGWLDDAMLLGTALGEHTHFAWICALSALLAWVRPVRAPGRDWLLVLAVFAVGYVAEGYLVTWLKGWLDFPRPPLALAGQLVVVGKPEFHHSLPSGHAAFAALVAASVWPIRITALRVLAAAFVLWVCLSRVYLGAHFPADVVAGTLLSIAVAWLVRRLLLTLMPTRDFRL